MKKSIFDYLGGDIKKKNMLPSVLTAEANKINNLKNITFSLSLLDTAITKGYSEDIPELLGVLIHFGLDYFILDLDMNPILAQDFSSLEVIYEDALKDNMDRKDLVGWTSFNSLKVLLNILTKMEKENSLLPTEDLEKAMAILIITSYIILNTLDIPYPFFKKQLKKSDIFTLNILNIKEKLSDSKFKHLDLTKPVAKKQKSNTENSEHFEITEEMFEVAAQEEPLVVTAFGSFSEPYIVESESQLG